MIAVITGDIVASRKLVNQEKWLTPLKDLLTQWGVSPIDWKIDRGDFFQIEIERSDEALLKALEIKALIKNIKPLTTNSKSSVIDVRMAIGIGDKTYSGTSISESNGTAFIYSGEKFDALKREDVRMGIKSPSKSFDEEMNLYLKLMGLFMDKWSVSSAEVVKIVLSKPNITQEEIGKILGIKQNSVSGRLIRAHLAEVLEVNELYLKKLKLLTHDHLS